MYPVNPGLKKEEAIIPGKDSRKKNSHRHTLRYIKAVLFHLDL